MNSGERARPEERGRDNTAPSTPEGSLENQPAPRIRGLTQDRSRVTVWILPTATENSWAVLEESDPQRLVTALEESAPRVYSIDVPQNEVKDAVEFGSKSVARLLREKTQERLFPLISRLVLGGAWVLVALAGLRVPGVAKMVDEVLLLAGLGFLGYTVFFNAIPFFGWTRSRKKASAAFQHAQWRHKPMLGRLAEALKYRGQLKDDERGKNPDAELLDANAYRKLIEEKVATVEEFSALGLAVEKALRIGDKQAPQKISEIARDCGITPETAIFYRDLAAAAAEIRLEHNYKI